MTELALSRGEHSMCVRTVRLRAKEDFGRPIYPAATGEKGGTRRPYGRCAFGSDGAAVTRMQARRSQVRRRRVGRSTMRFSAFAKRDAGAASRANVLSREYPVRSFAKRTGYSLRLSIAVDGSMSASTSVALRSALSYRICQMCHTIQNAMPAIAIGISHP
jgi:hypothetical protein